MNRRLLPFEAWPAIDRRLWDQARSKGDFLAKPGLASHWRPKSIATRIKSYGAWLAFLTAEERLLGLASPSQRVSEDLVRRYYAVLSNRNAPTTVLGRLEDLYAMIRTLEGQVDLPHLRRLIDRLRPSARPVRDKRGALINPAMAQRTVLDYLESRKADTLVASRKKLVDWRTALIVTMLINLPIRLANLGALRIGKSLIKRGDVYEVSLEREEVKTERPYCAPLPAALTPLLDHYIEHMRPRLLGDTNTDYLWASYRYGHLSNQTIYLSVKAFTQSVLGTAISPHQFRDMAVTFHAVHDSAHFHASSAILGHSSLKTTQKHYNQARMLDAVRLFQSGR
jgi:integrase/recombinase XerD